MIKKLLMLSLVLSLSFVLVACSNNTTQNTEETNEVTEENTEEMVQEENDEVDEEDIKIFELESGMFYYTPNEIKVKQGDTVRIVLNNVEGMHDWVLDEFNARTEIIDAGETTQVEFVADQTGTFEFYCSVGNHRDMGMVGTLIVE